MYKQIHFNSLVTVSLSYVDRNLTLNTIGIPTNMTQQPYSHRCSLRWWHFRSGSCPKIFHQSKVRGLIRNVRYAEGSRSYGSRVRLLFKQSCIWTVSSMLSPLKTPPSHASLPPELGVSLRIINDDDHVQSRHVYPYDISGGGIRTNRWC